MLENYSVKTLYKLKAKGKAHNIDKYYKKNTALYVERIILVKAKDFGDAIAKAEKEANEYINNFKRENHINHYGQKLKLKYLKCCDAFLILNKPNELKEVYCKMFLLKNNSENKFIDSQLGEEDDARKNKFMDNDYYEKYWKSSAEGVREPITEPVGSKNSSMSKNEKK
jgi:hypothetical protein